MFTTTFLLALIIALLVLVILALLGIFFSLSRSPRLRDFLIDSRFDRYSWQNRYYGPLIDMIEIAERELGVKLTWAAREMLLIPVVEQIQEGVSINSVELQRSIFAILLALREDGAAGLHSRSGAWNSLAIIKGFFKRYCSIPPFCKPAEEPTRGDRR